ncbi:MAG TPA: cytochrome c [Anaeromyxobacteraceae bacterium]|nr:cytochrome c [Anaeromyxobacteraceae bacterium]
MGRKLLAVPIALAILALAAGAAWDAGLLASRHPALPETPETVAHGRKVFARRCLHCHQDVPLRKRVEGWSAARAYEAIGRLPQIASNMPPFRGTEEERRALAAYLASLGAGREAR